MFPNFVKVNLISYFEQTVSGTGQSSMHVAFKFKLHCQDILGKIIRPVESLFGKYHEIREVKMKITVKILHWYLY